MTGCMQLHATCAVSAFSINSQGATAARSRTTLISGLRQTHSYAKDEVSIVSIQGGFADFHDPGCRACWDSFTDPVTAIVRYSARAYEYGDSLVPISEAVDVGLQRRVHITGLSLRVSCSSSYWTIHVVANCTHMRQSLGA